MYVTVIAAVEAGAVVAVSAAVVAGPEASVVAGAEDDSDDASLLDAAAVVAGACSELVALPQRTRESLPVAAGLYHRRT